METRKVIRIGDSHYVNIPADICEGLGIGKGDSLRVGYLSGYGIIITLDKGMDKISVKLESVDRLQRMADSIFSEFRRKAKSFEASMTFNLGNRMIGSLIKSGLIDIMDRVKEIETKIETPDQRRSKIMLLPRRKRAS